MQWSHARVFGYHSTTEHRLTIYTNGRDFLADMFLPSHWESQTRHQVASRTYRTMYWWRFLPSLDLETLGNRTQYEKKIFKTLNFFFQYLVMNSMCHFAEKIPAPHDHSNMLKLYAGPRNPPVGQSLEIEE